MIRLAVQFLCAFDRAGEATPFAATEGPMRFLSLRALFLLGFVIAMPVLALPPVARRIDELLYGPPPADFGRPPAAPLSEELMQQQAVVPVPSSSSHAQRASATGPSRFD